MCVCVCVCVCEINNVLLFINIIDKRQPASDWLWSLWMITGTVGCVCDAVSLSDWSSSQRCDHVT